MNEITEEIKKGAIHKRRIQGTAQLPVYRLSCNILYLLTELTEKTPRKLIRFTDKVLMDASETCKCISLANQFRGEERKYYISIALANVCVVRSYVTIMTRMEIINKDTSNKFSSMTKGLSAQLAAWKDSINREGQQ
jgi:hypothetical protein